MLLLKMFQCKTSTIFFLCLVLFNPVVSRSSRKKHKHDIRQLIDLIKRRNILGSDEGILGIPSSVEDLPRAEPIHPGHTLLQPSFGMLKSSIKYPHKDVGGTAVYGNVKNLGITHGKTNARVLYTDFRKANDLVKLLQALKKKSIRPKKSYKQNKFLIVKLDPSLLKKLDSRYADYSPAVKYNRAIEIVDDPNASYEVATYQTRRQRKPRVSRFRNRHSRESSEHKTDKSSSESSDYEHNPGNPYTVHKDKYKQNWLWNHFMDGNHMNVNPYAPPFNSLGPSGAQLFFGRKWWYFNQDDFKPLN